MLCSRKGARVIKRIARRFNQLGIDKHLPSCLITYAANHVFKMAWRQFRLCPAVGYGHGNRNGYVSFTAQLVNLVVIGSTTSTAGEQHLYCQCLGCKAGKTSV